MSKQTNNESGIVLVNKPRGLSSFSVVNIVKRVLGVKKAGHLGTLDMEAEGLLPITLNSATKLFDLFLNKDKTYTTKIKFGEKSDTFDLEGNIEKVDNKIITKEMLQKVLPSFIGEINQMPPNFSAKKINGVRAYELALKGEDFKLTPKKIKIYDIKLIRQLDENFFELEINCSAGTYIRAIARDLAEVFSTYAVCYDIIRTKCGVFSINNAFTLENIKEGNFDIISPDTLFNFSKLYLDKILSEKLLNGAQIKVNQKDGDYRLYDEKFLGVGNVKNNILKLIIRLN